MPKIIYENLRITKIVTFKTTTNIKPPKLKTFLKNMTTSELRELNPRPNNNP
jgi:hypothetical protein